MSAYEELIVRPLVRVYSRQASILLMSMLVSCSEEHLLLIGLSMVACCAIYNNHSNKQHKLICSHGTYVHTHHHVVW